MQTLTRLGAELGKLSPQEATHLLAQVAQEFAEEIDQNEKNEKLKRKAKAKQDKEIQELHHAEELTFALKEDDIWEFVRLYRQKQEREKPTQDKKQTLINSFKRELAQAQ